MSDGAPTWDDILEANPALAEAGFADTTARWNAFKAAADRLELGHDAGAAFIAYGMTDGEEGALPEGLTAQDVADALAEGVAPKP